MKWPLNEVSPEREAAEAMRALRQINFIPWPKRPVPAATVASATDDDLADPNAGQLVEADDGRTLRVGAFYWVRPTMDPDTAAGMGWMDEEQPARFAGRNAKGELLWHVLALEGDQAHDASSWPMSFIGDEIVRPGA